MNGMKTSFLASFVDPSRLAAPRALLVSEELSRRIFARFEFSGLLCALEPALLP